MDTTQELGRLQTAAIRALWTAQSPAGGSLPADIASLCGMSSHKIRVFLRALVRGLGPATKYLEIGSYTGSTAIAALADNQWRDAWLIDNFSQFDGTLAELTDNCQRRLTQMPQIICDDAFTCDISAIRDVDVFLYDGDHAQDAHYNGVLRFLPCLSEVAIVLLDDANWPLVVPEARRAFAAGGFWVAQEHTLSSRENGDVTGWWNGFYIAVVQRHG